MTITELLSELDKLSRAEKLRVIQHLAHDLETEESIHFAGEYEVWSPQDEGGAVATLHKLLEEDRRKDNAE